MLKEVRTNQSRNRGLFRGCLFSVFVWVRGSNFYFLLYLGQPTDERKRLQQEHDTERAVRMEREKQQEELQSKLQKQLNVQLQLEKSSKEVESQLRQQFQVDMQKGI
jgi:hypothetical protein